MKTDCMSWFSHSANCDPPIQPPNGYILPYSSTIEGAMVSVLCWNYAQQSIRKEGNLTCSYHGVWEPNPREVCGTNSDSAVTGTDNNTVWVITFKSRHSVHVYMMKDISIKLLLNYFLCRICSKVNFSCIGCSVAALFIATLYCWIFHWSIQQ